MVTAGVCHSTPTLPSRCARHRAALCGAVMSAGSISYNDGTDVAAAAAAAAAADLAIVFGATTSGEVGDARAIVCGQRTRVCVVLPGF